MAPCDTAVILEGARTPIGKFLGSFAETTTVELGTIAAVEAMRRSDVAPEQIDQTIMGHARQAGNGPNTGRQVSIRAGVPQEVIGLQRQHRLRLRDEGRRSSARSRSPWATATWSSPAGWRT